MKNIWLFCFLCTFCSLSMRAQETKKVVEIVDLSNLKAEEKISYDSNQPQKHDVVVERRWSPPGVMSEEEGYFYQIRFYHNPEDTLKSNFWGLITDKEFDKLYYSWQGDAVVLGRFENSSTKDSLRIRWTFYEDGSSRQELLDRPE